MKKLLIYSVLLLLSACASSQAPQKNVNTTPPAQLGQTSTLTWGTPSKVSAGETWGTPSSELTRRVETKASSVWNTPQPSRYSKPVKITKRKAKKARYSCGYKRYCSNISSCEEAYYLLEHCGLRRLDRDRDGVPCESLCN